MLVEIVKLAQKRGMRGTKGGWKEFLSIYDKKFGVSLSDPARRTVDVLVAFLNTFSEKDDLQVTHNPMMFSTSKLVFTHLKWTKYNQS